MKEKKLVGNHYNKELFQLPISLFTVSRIYNVHLIPMVEDQFYLTLEQGVSDMASLTGTFYAINVPESRTVMEQIKKINEAVKEGADALLVAAMDPVAVSGAIEDAKAKGVKIIYVDTPAYEEAITTLATDNFSAGMTAGKDMLYQLELAGIEEGMIGILGINTETMSTLDREKGFVKVIKEDGRYGLLDTVYTEGNSVLAREATEYLIKNNENMVGIFAANEGNTIGMGQGLEALNSSITAIGFDYTEEIKTLIENGVLQEVLVQNPYTMGYLGMAQAIAALKGYDTGPFFINTGVGIITKESLKKEPVLHDKLISSLIVTEQLKIYLIPIFRNNFFMTLEQGASDMAALTGVTLVSDFPKSSKSEEQIRLINKAINEGADALMIAATDPVAVSGAIEDAKAQGVKIIYVDVPAYEDAASTLATDNYKAGQLAGQTMIALLEALGIRTGSIGILGLNLTNPSTLDREKGFSEVLQTDGRFKLLEGIYTEGDPVKAEEAAEFLIRNNEELVGLFGTDEINTYGIGKAIETTGKKVIGIGFDVTDEIGEMVEEDILGAVFVQNPYTMGYLGMAQAIAALKGYDTGPPFINTGISVINKYSLYKGRGDGIYEAVTPIEKKYLVYIVPASGAQYWFVLNQGAKDMADLMGIISIMSIPKSRSAEDQIEKINQAVEAGADAILIGATDSVGIADSVKDAKERGVKIVYVDSPADEEAVITLATDNLIAGKIAGETMLAELEAIGIRNGAIGILGINVTSPTSMERERGFSQVINENGQFRLLNIIYTEAIPLVAKEATENLIKNTQDLIGMFATNLGNTIGLGQALEESEYNLIGIGFDFTKEIENYIENGTLQAVLVQNPYTMGYLGMAEAMAALKGFNTGPSYINTGVSLINKYSRVEQLL